MKIRLITFLSIFLYWIVYFVFAKILFLIFNIVQSAQLAAGDWIRILWHGLILDVSTTAYLLVIPTLIFLLSGFIPAKLVRICLNVYFIAMLIVVGLITLIDCELYRNWGMHLDTTPLLYLDNISLVFASFQWFTVFLLFFSVLCFLALTIFLYRITVFLLIKQILTVNHWSSLIFLILMFLLIIPVRGGLGRAPVSVSKVYFHEKLFANHAAVNSMWNLIYSITEYKELSNSYSFFEDAKAQKMFDSLTVDTNSITQILKVKRPNIIVVVLESFTAKIIHSLGGLPDITPNLDSLRKEGVLFTNCYATGDRTNRGLLAVLSAYPAMPVSNIMNYPDKAARLDYLTHHLKSSGYYSSFYYGGTIDFSNLRSYLLFAQFDTLTTIEDFDPKDCNSKWGAFDHVLFNRFIADLDQLPQPFFSLLLTSTSHEPFETPDPPVFKGSDEETRFLNAAHYTDKSIGDFIAKAKQNECWKNTIVIFTADHGMRLPGNTMSHEIKKFHIPMIWIGGALNISDSIVSKVCSQIDMTKSIIHQLGITSNDFRFSSDLFSQRQTGFAFYGYNNGFGFITDSTKIIYDNISNKCIYNQGNNIETTIETGKAYLQILSKDFSGK